MNIVKRVCAGVAIGFGVSASALVMSACSSTDPSAVVEVDGQRLDGTPGFTEIHCSYDSGTIGISSGGGDQQGGMVGSLSTDGVGVSTLTLLLDGMPHNATHTGSTDVGSVSVAHNGSRYTLTGTAQITPKSPAKRFRIEITCR